MICSLLNRAIGSVIAISLSLDAARRSQQEVELANVYFVAGDMERASTTARSLLEPHEGDDTRVASERLHRLPSANRRRGIRQPGADRDRPVHQVSSAI